jgi:long-chain fatty acid transport protein
MRRAFCLFPQMKTSTKLITLASTALALAAGAQTVRGAGFAIYETSARGFAVGNANVGRNNDASALYSNPAAITRLDGTQVTAGLSFIAPAIDVTTHVPDSVTHPSDIGTKDTSMNDYVQPVPHLYATRRITENLAAGLAVFVPYGLKSDFDPGWAGRYNNYLTDITTIDITPTVAYRIIKDKPWAKSVSIALGAQILYADVDLRRVLPDYLAADPLTAALADKQLILQGHTWEYGYSAAVQWEINDKIALGLVYRSGFKLGFDSATEEIVGAVPKHGGARGKINLPDSWAFGINYSPIPDLDLGLQLLRTGWSDYDKLEIHVPTLNRTSIKEKNWRDVWRYSLGAEYRVSDKIALRAGFVVDKDPVNGDYADYMVPSNDRLIGSIGLGWSISELVTVDFAYGYLTIKSTHINARPDPTPGLPPGRYFDVYDTDIHTGHAHIASVTANFRF